MKDLGYDEMSNRLYVKNILNDSKFNPLVAHNFVRNG